MRNSQQHGFSLLEILVAVVVISIGLLGIASLQASAVSATTASGMRGEAAINVANITSHMRANKAYWNELAEAEGSQTITVNVTSMTGALSSTDKDCLEVVCLPEELAAYDLGNWAEFLDSRLINPQALITLRSNTNPLISVNLTWTEKANNSILNTSSESHSAASIKSYTVMVSL